MLQSDRRPATKIFRSFAFARLDAASTAPAIDAPARPSAPAPVLVAVAVPIKTILVSFGSLNVASSAAAIPAA